MSADNMASSDVGAGGTDISAAAGGDAAGTADSGRGSTDYIQRVRTDPDFAEREVRNLKSRYDSTDAELRKMGERLGSLSPYLDQGIGGDQIAGYLQEYASIQGDPELSKMIQEYRAGGAKGSSSTDSADGYLTPEEEKIKALDSQVRELTGRLARQESSAGANQIRSSLTTVAEEIGLTPEINKRVMDKIAGRIGTWSQNHAKGDPNAMAALTQLQGPDSKRFVRTMIFNELEDGDLDEIAQFRALRKQNNARRFETDGPPEMATTGREPPPDFSKFKDAEAAALWARDNPHRHNSY